MEVICFRRVSSTAQSAAEAEVEVEDMEGLRVARVAEEERLAALVAMQKGEVLLTQKTSRQQDVTPMFGGRLANLDMGLEEEEEELFG